MSKNEINQGPPAKDPIKEFFGEVIYTYTSQQAEEDGFLFDVDQLIKAKKILPAGPVENFALKYITTGLLEEGYWTDRCKNGVNIENKGTADRCASCDVWEGPKLNGEKLSCIEEKTLNLANVLDLVSQALRIFAKMPKDDTFVSGRIELPSGQKQTVYLAQNETGRYTLMLPEDY